MGHDLDIEHVPAGCEPDGRRKDTGSATSVARESNSESIITLIHSACEGLSITSEQLYTELEEGSDFPDIRSGTITLKILRLTAETLSLMRYTANAEQGTKADKAYNMGEAA